MYSLPAIFAFRTTKRTGCLLINKELATLDTYTSQNFENHFVELNIVNRAGEFIMPKVAGTLMIVEATRAT
jgi:hypothetical protein